MQNFLLRKLQKIEKKYKIARRTFISHAVGDVKFLFDMKTINFILAQFSAEP